jgi:FSR family fosmidomycin resistance protein-like MFS transporter
MTGVILMAASFTSSLIQPLFGFLTDKQEKPILLPFGCLCAGIGFSFITLAPNYTLVLALVVISGLGIASYHPEGYKTAHFFTGERRVTGMAIFSVGGNVGFALVPRNISSFVYITNMISWHKLKDGGCHVAKISSNFDTGGTYSP